MSGILHGQADGGGQQSPRRDRVGQRAFQPQILVLRFPLDAESALEITAMNSHPDAVSHRVLPHEPDDEQRADERADAGDLHHHRRLGASWLSHAPGTRSCSPLLRTGSGEAEPDLAVVGIDRAPAHLTSLLIHIPTLAHRTG